MTITEAFADSKSLIKNQADVDDITFNFVTDKGVILGENETEGRSETMWFKTQTEKDDYLSGKS